MGKTTSIAWCDSTVTPLFGCAKVSEACEHCYAEKIAVMRAHNQKVAHLYEGTVKDGHWSGRLNLLPERMKEVLRWKKPRRIFVASQSDLFHEDVPDEFLDTVFAYMAMAPQHTFILLTKRAKRMRDYIVYGGGTCIRIGIRQALERMGFPDIGAVGQALPNVHTYVTIENQQRMEERLPALLETPSVLRGVSMEPLLGDIDLTRCPRGKYSALDDDFHNALSGEGWSVDCMEYPATSKNGPRIDHVIAGGESGRGARPSHPAWFRAQRDQCAKYGCVFTFKQWGEWGQYRKDLMEHGSPITTPRGYAPKQIVVEGTPMLRYGKKLCGRLLDGVEHLALPQIANDEPEGR